MSGADARTPSPTGTSRAGPAPAPPTEILVEDVRRSFGDRVVLDAINLRVGTGEIVAIVGGSGSGKTVLLDHMTGLMLPDSGRILVADHSAGPSAPKSLRMGGTVREAAQPAAPLVDLAQVTEEQLDRIRLHWSIVFQHNALFSGTVYENVALWLREHTDMGEAAIRRRVVQSLEAVALDPADVLEKQREALSGGMAKRVAIARAIATNPLVIFYDEPTTGLDPVVGGHIHELIWTTHHLLPASAGHAARTDDGGGGETADMVPRTSIIVTHDKELLRRLAPRVIMLFEGTVCFDGTYEQFLQSALAPARAYLQAMPVLHARPSQDAWPHGHRA